MPGSGRDRARAAGPIRPACVTGCRVTCGAGRFAPGPWSRGLHERPCTGLDCRRFGAIGCPARSGHRLGHRRAARPLQERGPSCAPPPSRRRRFRRGRGLLPAQPPRHVRRRPPAPVRPWCRRCRAGATAADRTAPPSPERDAPTRLRRLALARGRRRAEAMPQLSKRSQPAGGAVGSSDHRIIGSARCARAAIKPRTAR